MRTLLHVHVPETQFDATPAAIEPSDDKLIEFGSEVAAPVV
jgi:hypothetical protein